MKKVKERGWIPSSLYKEAELFSAVGSIGQAIRHEST